MDVSVVSSGGVFRQYPDCRRHGVRVSSLGLRPRVLGDHLTSRSRSLTVPSPLLSSSHPPGPCAPPARFKRIRQQEDREERRNEKRRKKRETRVPSHVWPRESPPRQHSGRRTRDGMPRPVFQFWFGASKRSYHFRIPLRIRFYRYVFSILGCVGRGRVSRWRSVHNERPRAHRWTILSIPLVSLV